MRWLQIQMFGRLSVLRDEQLLTTLKSHKLQELLCYLLVHFGHPHPRESLASLLWSDLSTAQSRTYLRKALWALQHALDAPSNTHGSVFQVEPEWIQFDVASDVWVDVHVFHQAFESVQSVAGRELDKSRASSLRQAVDLYRGELLEGWYQDWCLRDRERLQHMYLAMLDKLMGYCEAHRTYEAGLAYGNRILCCDDARERTHRRLMRLHFLNGDRTAALRQYEHCVTILSREFNVGPDPETVALYEQIRSSTLHTSVHLSDHVPAARREGDDPEDASSPNAPFALLSDALNRLRRFQLVLADVQCQVQQDIDAVEQSMMNCRQ